MANAVNFFEVTGKDADHLRGFYDGLFGWEFRDIGDPTYSLVAAHEGGIAGGIGSIQDGGAGGATFYVEVDDIEAALSRAEQLGGRTVMPPRDVPGGSTIAKLADPEGHVLGLSMRNTR